MSEPDVSSAIIAWTGWGQTPMPAREDRRVTDLFGADGFQVLPLIRDLARDFDTSDAKYVEADLAKMGERAAAQFRARHPEVSQDASAALEWCYTFDNR